MLNKRTTYMYKNAKKGYSSTPITFRILSFSIIYLLFNPFQPPPPR